jgi:FkbM family methyltransferase
MWFKELSADATANFFLNFVKPGDTVFDIGAHIGTSALIAAPLAGETGRVVSFEPNPAAFAGLEATIRNSGYKNIIAAPMAVSDRTGAAIFYIDTRVEFGGVGSSLREMDGLAGPAYWRRTTVPCTTIDDYRTENGASPNVVKIDVESFEPQVIAGGRRTIETLSPILLFEFWETWWDKGFRELFEYLTPMYRLIRMQDGKDVERFYYSNSGGLAVDILCLPR